MIGFESKKRNAGLARLLAVAITVAALQLTAGPAWATIPTIPGPNFNLTARANHISTPDGAAIYAWGYTNGSTMQLPGPTLEVTAGTVVTVTLNNALPVAAGNVSIVFPGHTVTTTSGGVPGLLTREAAPGGSVSYTFTATNPGTYLYHSGTRPDLQVEMGLYGAMIVRPVGAPGCAYNHTGTCYTREHLFLLSEIDIEIHQSAELQASGPGPMVVATEPYTPEYWLLNGRTAPDTMAAAGTAQLPTQPYNSIPRMHPGERLLMRVVGAGRQIHPFHTHGNHARVLARDGRMVVSSTNQLAGPNLFTIPSVPGGTVDAIFEWTGKDLGWDIYGHSAGDALQPNEWAPDHGKPIPVTLPDLSVQTFGGFYSGSPFLGVLGSLPPGEGGLNPNAGFTHMFHSHTERELVNNDVFPGGMMTMLIIEPWSVTID